MNYKSNKIELEEKGYSLIGNLYSHSEVKQILGCIESAEQSGSSFMKNKDVFAIRQLLKNVPQLSNLLFNEKLKALLNNFFDSKYFLTKATYSDKPAKSNWFVAYHQDLSISVTKKAVNTDYVNWTFKKGQFGVQPPVKILENTITIRIHLDNTDENNGALKVIPKSHSNGIIRLDSKEFTTDGELVCKIKKGEAMVMKPLTMHASNRATNGKRRRVIHLEFSNMQLEMPISWLEYHEIK